MLYRKISHDIEEYLKSADDYYLCNLNDCFCWAQQSTAQHLSLLITPMIKESKHEKRNHGDFSFDRYSAVC